MKSRHLPSVIGLYVFCNVLFYFMGDSSDAWTAAFYGFDKLFSSALLFIISGLVYGRHLRISAYYGASVNLFFFLFFVWCFFFGYETVYVVGALLIYSLLTLIVINIRTR